MENPFADRVRAVVDVALQQPADSRLEFLRTVCGGDTGLLSDATKLLDETETGIDSASSHGADAPTSDGGSEPRQPFPRTFELPFRGTGRFVLHRRLGSGGFGVVYEARDLLKDTTVALKTLQNVTSESLYRFKREFRSLVDITHRNLVQLYELGSHEDQWFFTMELVNGRHFLEHVADRRVAPQGTPATMRTSLNTLLPALRQLIEGLTALHRSGHVHRDVKPSNVLVTPEGRVVLLDFGLVLEVAPQTDLPSMMIAGTPTYMSPEQAAGLPVTPASDWYSLGVMLYQALTGTVPFTGAYLQILTDKQRIDPPPPGALVHGIPAPLNDLCQELLRRDSARRPHAEEILERLDAMEPRGVNRARPPARAAVTAQPFVGRVRHLTTLHAAFEEMLAGTPAVATVFGPSGIGKSALIRAFLDRVRERRPDTVILTGRCYERESVPYKALDSCIDSLARYFKRLPADEAKALLPRDVGALAQLFPILREWHDRVSHRAAIPTDVQELRRRGRAALRDLLARLGESRPLLVVIDDLQWGDVDSATLLAEVLLPPDAPVLLLVAAYRDVEIETSPFLRAFVKGVSTPGRNVAPLRVEPLTAEESRQLATALLRSTGSPHGDVVSVIASESGGSPFFIDELVRFADTAGGMSAGRSAAAPPADTDAREATLEHMLEIRLSRLPSAPQRLLRIVAVNGRPLPEAVLKTAAEVPNAESALALLRSEHLLRGRETDAGVEFEAYHDRIREIVLRMLGDEELRECHKCLATAWECDPSADAALVGEHYAGAGDDAHAAHYTRLAAQQAERALAFDRAARLYRRTLELIGASSDAHAELMTSLGRALAHAGRPGEAAVVYLAAPATTAANALVLKQKAAEQLLFGGHIDHGLRVVREVLGAIGMTLPDTRWKTLLALLAGRARVRLRGLRYRARPASIVPAGELMRIDACWSVSAGLSVVDTMRGAVFQTRHLLLALHTGELERVHRALCLEAGFAAIGGSRTIRRAQRIRLTTADTAHRLVSPYAEAMHLLMGAVCDYLVGQWAPAATAFTAAERLLTEQCTGVLWELDSCRFYGLWSRYQLGDVKSMVARFPVLLKDAEDRGDLYACTALNGLMAHVVYLASGDSETASRHTADAIRRWSQPGFHMPQLWELWSFAEIALYEGRGPDAWDRVERSWPALQRSLLLEVQLMRVFMLNLRARAALAAAIESRKPDHRERYLRASLRCAKAMNRERVGWAAALALMIRAGVHQCRGRGQLAATAFEHAHDALVALDMSLLAAVARRRRGELVAGAAGAALIAECDTWMRAQHIRDPARMARMFAPCEVPA